MNPSVIPDFDALTAGYVCYLCHAPRREGDKVVRTGIDIVAEGSLDICTTCCRVLGEKAGCATPQQTALMNATLQEQARLIIDAANAQAEMAALRATLEAERAEVRRMRDEWRAEVRKEKASA